MARAPHVPRLHHDRMATAAVGLVHAPDLGRMRTFRHWAWAFEVVDHEAASTTAAVLAGGAAILTALAVAAGGALRADGEGLTVAAWLAMVCLGAGLLLAASEAAAWAIARPIGR